MSDCKAEDEWMYRWMGRMYGCVCVCMSAFSFCLHSYAGKRDLVSAKACRLCVRVRPLHAFVYTVCTTFVYAHYYRGCECTSVELLTHCSYRGAVMSLLVCGCI